MIVKVPCHPYIVTWMEDKSNRELATKVFNALYYQTKQNIQGSTLPEYTGMVCFNVSTYRRLLPRQIINFNATLTKIITRDTLNTALTILEYQPNIKLAVEAALRKHNIDEFDFSPGRIIKAIQRHRAKHGGIYIYKNRKQ